MKAVIQKSASFGLAAVRHLVSALAGLITIPLVARALGTDALGLWALIGTAAFALGLADLGLGVAVQRATARGDDAEVRKTIGIGVTAVLLVGPIISALSYACLLDLPNAAPELLADARRAAQIAFVGGVIGALAYPYRGFLVVRGALKGLATVRALAVVLQVVVTWFGLRAWHSLVAPALGLFVAATIETLGSALAARALDRRIPLWPVAPESPAALYAVLREGAGSLAVNVSAILALRFDIVILSRLCPLATVAAYGVASRVVDQSFTLAKQTSLALLPRLADRADRARAVRVGTALLGGAVASGMAAMNTQGREVLVAWAGDVARQPETWIALALLSMAAVFAASHEVAAATLTLAGGSTWDAALPLALGYIVNLLLSVSLASRLGVVAVAGGTLLGNAATSVALWHRARVLLAWRVRAVASALAPVGAGAVVALGLGLGIGSSMTHSPLTSLVGCALVTMAGIGTSAVLLKRTA